MPGTVLTITDDAAVLEGHGEDAWLESDAVVDVDEWC